MLIAEVKAMGVMVLTRFGRPVPVETTIRDIRFDSEEWRISTDYICIGCGEHALVHPDNDRYWACRKCFIKTDCLLMHFTHVRRDG